MLILGVQHKVLFQRLVHLNRYAAQLAALSGIIFAGWLYVMLTPPGIEHKFSTDDIYPLHENAWLASFNGDVPNWRVIKTNDYLYRIKSENDFFEDGKIYPGNNRDCLQEYSRRDMQNKCWGHISDEDYRFITETKADARNKTHEVMSGATADSNTRHVILFRLPPGEDPRISGKHYEVKTKLVVSKSISLTALILCSLLILPMAWQFSRKNGSDFKRFSLLVSVWIIGFITIFTIFYGGLFYSFPNYLLDSYGYTTLNLFRPIGTWLFFKLISLMGNFDRLLIPVHYFMTVTALAVLCWMLTKLTRKSWIFSNFISGLWG